MGFHRFSITLCLEFYLPSKQRSGNEWKAFVLVLVVFFLVFGYLSVFARRLKVFYLLCFGCACDVVVNLLILDTNSSRCRCCQSL